MYFICHKVQLSVILMVTYRCSMRCLKDKFTRSSYKYVARGHAAPDSVLLVAFRNPPIISDAPIIGKTSEIGLSATFLIHR